jgi:hypothetical protein
VWKIIVNGVSGIEGDEIEVAIEGIMLEALRERVRERLSDLHRIGNRERLGDGMGSKCSWRPFVLILMPPGVEGSQ